MKKMVAIVVAVLCSTAIIVKAQDKPKHELTPEQQAVMKDMLEKYDTNKDGKLDKEERAKISDEDKAKMAEAGLGKHHGQAGDAKKDGEQKPAADGDQKPAGDQ